jgi:hypothetical protein
LPFNPQTIPQFSVIKIPVQLIGYTELKRFVVISHIPGHVYALKTTSQTETFDHDPQQLKGVVVYEAAECPMFEKRTVIDPRNQFPISYSDLIQHDQDGCYEHLGILPADFKQRLIDAVTASRLIEPNRKKRLLLQLA